MATMDELFARARREGLWLWCRYQDLWFSPDELARAQANGRFRWGPVNWELRPPAARVEQLQRDIEKAQAAMSEFGRRMAGGDRG